MPKISALPAMTAPDEADPAPVVDDSVSTTKKMTIGQVRDWLYSLVNIPAGPASPVTRDSEHFFDHVASGLVWSGDAYASTRNASMSAGVAYINGRRISISAVVARSFTASRDTYIDILDNLDGTGTLVYTEVTNNNASPALAANSLRIGIIVTGASNIAAVGSVNQGQEDRILPIASSIAYSVTDSLGNIICNRSPTRTVLGHKQILSSFATSSSSYVQVTGLSMPIIVPTNRKVQIEFDCRAIIMTVLSDAGTISLWDGAVGSGVILGEITLNSDAANDYAFGHARALRTLSAGLHTINVGFKRATSGTVTIQALTADNPAMLTGYLV